MQLGVKRESFLRHLFVAGLGALLVYLFYLSYGAWGVKPALWPDWGQDHPFWRAWAHAAFVLLFLSLILGPAAKLWQPVARFIPWRRELGIWFAVLAFGHGYAIWDRWARWDLATLFGFVEVEQFGGYILARPEVGIMNMMGLMVAPMIILLAITSFDRAVSFLGPSSWKWLHNSLVHVIFYMLMARGILYLFFFFQFSPPDWRVYPPIWFLYVFLGMGVFAVVLQAAAFAKTVLQRRARRTRDGQRKSILHMAVVVGVALLFVLPVALPTVTVAYFDSRLIKTPLAVGGRTPGELAQNYAQDFHMVIHDVAEDIHLWARNLDSAPYFRLTREVAGSPVEHRIYRYSERTLYIAELNEGGQLAWFKIENVGPQDIGISDVAARPGVWAAQYGVGEHQIRLAEGMVSVTIHSVGETIADEIFELPTGVDPTPITP